jgi:hypothetical protein
MNSKIVVSLLALALVNSAYASNLEQFLKDFEQDSKKAMQQIPAKTLVIDGHVSQDRAQQRLPFGDDAIRSKRYIEAKNQARKVKGRAGIEGNDKAEDLVDNGSKLVRSLADMEKKKLLEAKLPKTPWSDYYWALVNGQTAFRYADAAFTVSSDWKKNFEYINKGKFSSVDVLSPAEKYDLLVGDKRKTLTQTALAEGEQYYRSHGKVESWMGICHGWAPAAYMLDRPSKAVKVTAADGKTLITFYPADIKALGSLLWAKAAPGGEKFIGGRCNDKNPKRDENGRVISQDCFDTNPGAWHMAVVNQIGINKRSMVLDATYDYEVWNQPIYSYTYTYFNPQTLRPVSTLKAATVDMKDFSKDKFKKYRDPRAVTVVGVSMSVTYTVETDPKPVTRDSSRNDAFNTASYQYDLEIDAKGNIIGGEWYTNLHPDFLWTPTADAKAYTPGDVMLVQGRAPAKWDGMGAMPVEWQKVAPANSQGGAPLATVVDALIEISNNSIR